MIVIYKHGAIFLKPTILLGLADAIRYQIGTWCRKKNLLISGLYLVVGFFILSSSMLYGSINSIFSKRYENLAGSIAQEHSDSGRGRSKELHILTTIEAPKSNHKSLEHRLLVDFAREHQLKPVWVSIQDTEQLLSYQQNQNTDLIVSVIEALTPDMGGKLKFTLPWAISTQQVVVRSNTDRMDSIDDIQTSTITIKRSSPIWPMLDNMAKHHRMMSLAPMLEETSVEQILNRVSSGHYDITVQDSLLLENNLPKYLDLEVAFSLTSDKIMAWAVSPDTKDLHTSLDQFLYKKHLKLDVAQFYREDLPGLKKKKSIEIAYCNPVTYYMDQGALKGFKYELTKHFAKDNHM